ncbi:MAG: IS1380 family transposase [Chloroflexi bacterium]|nr:IS1380 family transposase [Chloroflexota bacterium]
MGDGNKAPLRLKFNLKVRLEFHGATITSDAGLLACRELDDALGLTDTANEHLQERRSGRNIRHQLVPLLRQSIYSRLAGYDDTNDAERLAQDPAMRVVVGWQDSDRRAASTNTLSRFETETLTQESNLKGLAQLNTQWVEGAMAHTIHRRVILDMDSSESPVHGQQEGSAYNGHFECVCYHPLFLFNQFGDCEGATLRSGNVHSADKWRELLEPVVKGYQQKGMRLLFRADAAFAKPEVYEYLETYLTKRFPATSSRTYLPRFAPASTLMYVVCAWCCKVLRTKDGHGQTGVSHSICPRCVNDACAASAVLLARRELEVLSTEYY